MVVAKVRDGVLHFFLCPGQVVRSLFLCLFIDNV